MPYILIKNGKTVQHITFSGNIKKYWKREQKVDDLLFNTLEAANETAEVLDAEAMWVA